MIIAITFLLAFGLIMIFSASSYGTAASNFRSQLVFIVFGALAIWGLAFFPYGLYKKLTWPAYFLSLILTFLLLTPLGVNVNGATRWIQIPHIPFRIQIADIVKTLMIIFIASFISDKWREMHKWQTVIILWVLVGLQAGLFARHIHKPEFVSGRSWNMLLFNIYSQQELETAFGNIADSCGGGGGLCEGSHELPAYGGRTSVK